MPELALDIEKLREAIKASGVTQKQLSATLGITEKALSEKMQHKKDFWLTEILKICSIVGARLQDLLVKKN